MSRDKFTAKRILLNEETVSTSFNLLMKDSQRHDENNNSHL